MSSDRPPFDAAIFKQAERLTFACILGLTVAVFAQGLFGGFVWDDARLIQQHERALQNHRIVDLLREPTVERAHVHEAPHATYRPLVTLSYLVDFALYGPRPFGYHLLNLLLHLGCVSLLFHLLYSRLSRIWYGPAQWQALAGATTGALLFALHPSRPEVVSWISGRADALMTLFVLLGLLWFERTRNALRGALTGLCFALSLFCREAAFVAPLFLFADLGKQTEGSSEHTATRRQARFALAIMLGAILMRAWLAPLPPMTQVLATPAHTFATLGRAILTIVWPAEPSSITKAPQAGLSAWHVSIGILGLISLGGTALWTRKATHLHTQARAWLADVNMLAIALLPMVLLAPLRSDAQLTDRSLYLPLMGASAIVAHGMAKLLDLSPRRVTFGTLAVIFALTVCALRTLAYVPAFASDTAHNDYEYANHPDDTNVLEARAQMQQARGDHAAALRTAMAGYEAASKRNDQGKSFTFMLLAVRFLSSSLRDTQQPELHMLVSFYEALERGDRAELNVAPLRLATTLSAVQHKTLLQDLDGYILPRAFAYTRIGEVERGVALIEQTLEATPSDPRAWLALAQLEALAGRYNRAQDALLRASKLTPETNESRSLQQRILAARTLTEAPAPDAAAQALSDAQAKLMLGSAVLASRALEPALANAPDDPALIVMGARIEAVQGELAAARTRIDRALLRMPEERARFSEVLAELDQIEGKDAPQQSGGTTERSDSIAPAR